MSDEEWGPWHDHDGSGCPVPTGTVVECVHLLLHNELLKKVETVKGGESWFIKEPTIIDWEYVSAIISYRVKKSKGMQILQEILNKVEKLENA